MLKFNEGIDGRALLQHLAAMCIKFINRIVEVAYCPIPRVCPSRHNDTPDKLDAVPVGYRTSADELFDGVAFSISKSIPA